MSVENLEFSFHDLALFHILLGLKHVYNKFGFELSGMHLCGMSK
jgi:hypothetical protein